MEISRDLLAAIGEVAIETAKLEYAIARLVAARCGWGDEHVRAIVSNPGEAARRLGDLVRAEPGWAVLAQLHTAASAVRSDRAFLMHAVVVEIDDESGDTRFEWWHAKSGAAVTLDVVTTEELAFDIGRCFRRTVDLVHAADDRRQRLGPVLTVRPPKLPA